MSTGLLARVVVLAGPSGSGKSRLAERTGLPVLRLDDFYKDGDDPTLPRITAGQANAGTGRLGRPGLVAARTTPSPRSSRCAATGRADVPVYDIAHNGRTGWQHLDLGGATCFVAEGIFAQEIVPRAREAGLLADALCVRQHPAVTFWRRLTRDLREHRKPPLVLVRRGLALMRGAARRRRARRRARLPPGRAPRRRSPASAASSRPWLPEAAVHPLAAGLRQPDPRSCGAASARDGPAAPRPRDADAREAVPGRGARVPPAADRPRVPTALAAALAARVGTPPWAVARELEAITGVDHDVAPGPLVRRRASYDRLAARRRRALRRQPAAAAPRAAGRAAPTTPGCAATSRRGAPWSR